MDVPTPARLVGFDSPTVWHEFTPLAQKHKACNLGQGFPDYAPPLFARQFMNKAVEEDNENQYARSAGHPKLVSAISDLYSPWFNLGRKIDPLTEVLITVGATEALFVAMQGIVSPGDEIVVFEPAFDIYSAQAQMAGGKLVRVPLTVDAQGQWVFDLNQFASAFNSKTRMLLLNSPHNPTGKVFTRAELESIAAVVAQHPNVVVVSDEVYEFLTFDSVEHVRFASLPGMFERTLTSGSAGKTFSTTGWKVGWLIGGAHLVRLACLAHQWVAFCVSTPAQVAVAQCLERAMQEYEGEPSYFAWLRKQFEGKRDKLIGFLRKAGLSPLVPSGGYFIMADHSAISIPSEYLAEGVSRDYAFCRWLTTEIGVAAIPPTAFVCDENKPQFAGLARFAICKSDEVLDEAGKRLAKISEK